jgi:hypothetical protein
MEIKIERVVELGQGKSAAAVHTPDNKFRLLYVDPLEKKLYSREAETPMGQWESLELSDPEMISADTDVSWIDSTRISGYRDWYVWGSDDTTFMRMATDPDKSDRYVDSPYRLYYAVDSEKMYMNISELWTYVGSPKIEKLIGYDQLISRIATIETSVGLDAEEGSTVLARLESIETRLTDFEQRLIMLEGGTPPESAGPTEITTFPYVHDSGIVEVRKAGTSTDITGLYYNSTTGRVETKDSTGVVLFGEDKNNTTAANTTWGIGPSGVNTTFSVSAGNITFNVPATGFTYWKVS